MPLPDILAKMVKKLRNPNTLYIGLFKSLLVGKLQILLFNPLFLRDSPNQAQNKLFSGFLFFLNCMLHIFAIVIFYNYIEEFNV